MTARGASILAFHSSRTEFSDDEASDVSNEVVLEDEEVDTRSGLKATGNDEESLMVESDKDEGDEDDDEDEDEEIGEDEFVVEAIKNHIVDEDTGELLYEVKWEGYEKKSERTWEPESNLATAPEILQAYLAKVGGKEQILSQWEEKKAEAEEKKKGKKRSRASTGTPQGANGMAAKKGRKNGHPASATPPASAKATEFKPPTGSWEEEVVGIDACEGQAGTVVVYLTWKGGQKSRHPLAQVYKRCPQKMLKFYESHLVFKKNDDAD